MDRESAYYMFSIEDYRRFCYAIPILEISFTILCMLNTGSRSGLHSSIQTYLHDRRAREAAGSHISIPYHLFISRQAMAIMSLTVASLSVSLQTFKNI